MNLPDPRVHTIDTITTNNHGLILYEAEKKINWCQSYQACNNAGLRLAVAVTEEIQTSWRDVIPRMKADLLWVGGRRKDFGGDWTWLDDELSDCQEKVGNETFCQGLPKSGEVIKSSDTQSWHEAMNTCVKKGQILAMYDEAVEYMSRADNPYFHWIALTYRPWLWILGGTEESQNYSMLPMLYSSWSNTTTTNSDSTSEKYCLSIDTSDGYSWIPQSCDTKLKYFLCEAFEIAPLTTTYGQSDEQETSIETFRTTAQSDIDRSVSNEKDMVPLIVGIVVPFVLIIVALIIGVTLYTRHMKQTLVRSIREIKVSKDFFPGVANAITENQQEANMEMLSLAESVPKEYCLIRESQIISNKPNFRPRPPARDPTYNQAYEDTRIDDDNCDDDDGELSTHVQGAAALPELDATACASGSLSLSCSLDDLHPLAKRNVHPGADVCSSSATQTESQQKKDGASLYPKTGHVVRGYLQVFQVEYENLSFPFLRAIEDNM